MSLGTLDVCVCAFFRTTSVEVMLLAAFAMLVHSFVEHVICQSDVLVYMKTFD